MPDGSIRFRTRVPDHESYTPPIDNSWAQAQYGKGTEELPNTYQHHAVNLPPRMLMPILCFATGKSTIVVRYPPLQCFAKKPNTVETATYGSELMVA